MSFTKMAQCQSELVDAVLDGIERDDWILAYLHSEFRDDEGFLVHFEQGFLVVKTPGGVQREPLPVESGAALAMEQMHAVYHEAGHGFSRLDLLVEADGPYRFDLDDTPSLVLAGEADPDRRDRLDRRFAELVRERGLNS
jgi:hypothetical protein